MKIWYQSMTEIGRYPAYRSAIEEHGRSILPDEVHLHVAGVDDGTYGGYPPIELLTSPYLHHVLLRQVLNRVQLAEAQSYDCFIIGSFSEPFLREARSIARIPIVSLAESTLLVACSYGRKIGVVTINPAFGYETQRLIERHGISGRLAGIAVLEPPVTEDDLAEAFRKADDLVRSFRSAATSLIGRHADVIIAGEGVLNEFLNENDVREIDGTSVVDSVAVTLLYAHMQVLLHRGTGLHAGRAWEYRRPDDTVLANLGLRVPPAQ